MGWRRRLRALVHGAVVLSLLAPGSLGARATCDACPPDCAMHRRVAAPEAPPLPCHRTATASAPIDERVIRAACGATEHGDLTIQLRDQPPRALLRLARVAASGAPAAVRAPQAPASDVPTGPPEDGRSS